MANVVVENQDFETLIKHYDRTDTFFYADPPYFSTEDMYAVGFNWNDHVRLRNTLAEIKGKFLLYEQVQEQLEGCDMVLDGAFEEAKLETKRKILGSTNQRILCLTDRYKDCVDWFLAPTNKSIEINVGSTIFANGDKI